VIEDLVLAYGASHACRRVRAVDLSVSAPESGRKTALARPLAETHKAIAEAIVLGCAGMADVSAELSRATGLPVIDGVVAAVKLAEALVGGGSATSKPVALAFPRDTSGDSDA
jgi:allantoin racemase